MTADIAKYDKKLVKVSSEIFEKERYDYRILSANFFIYEY